MFLECWQLFEALRPGEASTDPKNDVASLVTYTWELATGQKDEELAKAIGYAKNLLEKDDELTPAEFTAIVATSIYREDLERFPPFIV